MGLGSIWRSLVKIKILKEVINLSFKSALIYDMDYIIKEIDSIETEELEEIQKNIKKFMNVLNNELNFRKDKF